MALTHTVELEGRAVTLRELTVQEVRDWALRAEQGLVPADAVGHLCLDQVSLYDLELMGAPLADLNAMTASELEAVLTVAKRLNPHFFRVRAAMAAAALRLMR
jgi:hypothetical protein